MIPDNQIRVFSTYSVGIPVYTWSASLLVVCNRKVRLLEETVTRLVNEGVPDIDDIAHLLGLDDPAIVLRTIHTLIDRGVLSYSHGQALHVTERVGQEMLSTALVKDERRMEKVRIEFDPLRKRFSWNDSKSKLIKLNDLKNYGIYPIRPPTPLSENFLSQHFREIQNLVRTTPDTLRQHPLGRDVVKFELQDVLPAQPQLRYVLATLEVSQHPNGDWTYRLLREGNEDPISTDILRTWDVDGYPVLPLQDSPLIYPEPDIRALLHTVSPLTSQESNVFEFDEQRLYLREAIQSASTSLLVAPATGTIAYSNDLSGWIENAVNASMRLKVVIAVERGSLHQKRRSGYLKQQVSSLISLQNKYPERINLIEMRTGPYRVVIIDGAKIVMQVIDGRQYSTTKYFLREVIMPSIHVLSDLGREIEKCVARLLLPPP